MLKPVDAWWSVLVIDPIATRLARALTPRRAVSPTALTVSAHALGVVAAALFLLDAPVAAAALFELRFVLDCADGKLARARGSSTAAGAYLDYVGDFLVVGSTMAALGVHLAWEHAAPAVLVVGLPAAFLAYIAAIRSREVEVIKAGGEVAREATPGSYRARMAARRLRPTPSGIDVEHTLLFITPVAAALLDAPGLLEGVAWAAAAYYGYRTLRITGGGYRIARRRDRTPPAAP